VRDLREVAAELEAEADRAESEPGATVTYVPEPGADLSFDLSPDAARDLAARFRAEAERKPR
jgi:hypothetical protein